MSQQEQKRRQRPGGKHDEELGEEASGYAHRDEIDLNEKMKKLTDKIREANDIVLGLSKLCCDQCGCPCHPGGGCRLDPICSDGVHPCPC